MYSWSVIEGYGSEIRVQRYDFFKNYARVKMIIRSNCAKIAHHSFICHCYPLTESTNLSIKVQCDQPFSERHIYRLCTVYVPSIALPLPYHSSPLCHLYITLMPPLYHLYTTPKSTFSLRSPYSKYNPIPDNAISTFSPFGTKEQFNELIVIGGG